MMKIIAAVKKSYALFSSNKNQVLICSWIAFTLLLTFDLLMYYTNEPLITLTTFLPVSPLVNINNYLYLIVDGLITAPMTVALYRYFILSEKNYSKIKIREGVAREKKPLAIFWYFKFTKKEVFIFLFYILISSIFLLLRDVNMLSRVNDNSLQQIGTLGYSYLPLHYALYFLEHITFAAIILIWPMIAVKERFALKEIPKSILKVQGNVLRICFVFLILSSPVYMFYYSGELMLYITDNITPELKDVINVLYITLYVAIYFVCLSLQIAFASLVFKEIKGHEPPSSLN